MLSPEGAGGVPEIIPAIDVLGGRCVRLRRGDETQATDYGDPVDRAERYAAEGASWIHLIDLDAAFGRPPGALEVVGRVAERTGLRIQLGGGLRSLKSLEAARAAGAGRLIVGTAALEEPGFLARAAEYCGSDLVLALDLRNGRPLVRGWLAKAPLGLDAALKLAASAGVEQLLITDVAADGTLSGVSPSSYEPALDTGTGILAAGGVATLDDVRVLARLARRGLSGIVIGSALLRGEFTLGEARCAARLAAGPSFRGAFGNDRR